MATSSYYKFDSFVDDQNEGIHEFGANTLKVALTPTLPVVGDEVLLDVAGTISVANLDGVTVTTTSSTETGGTYSLICADLVMTATGTVPDFRYVVLYNDSPTTPKADPLICWYDYGSTVSMVVDDTFTLDFNASGVFTET